jgi:hypothetical protein
MHTIFTWKQTLFISLLFKKNWNFRPIVLGNMEILKKRGYWEFGTASLLQLRWAGSSALKSGVAKLFFHKI